MTSTVMSVASTVESPIIPDFLSLVAQSRLLNTKVFSLSRLMLLSSLAILKEDGATVRELKAALDISDGTLYANLKALAEMGYVRSEKVILEGKELESFRITPDGITEWERIHAWLCKFLECEVSYHG